MTESAVAIPDDAIEPNEDDLDLDQEGVEEDAQSLAAIGVEPARIEQHKKWAYQPNAKWRTFASPAEILEYAAEVGADMTMGLYVDGKGQRWKPHKPIVAEIMRHLGYGVAYHNRHASSHRPVWWPERGMIAFLDYVSLKVSLRRQTGAVRLEQMRPYMESLVGLAVVELTRRLTISPDKVATRDLSDIVSRITGRMSHGQDLPVGTDGVPKSAEGRTIYMAIVEQATQALPEGLAREQMLKLFHQSITSVAESTKPTVIDMTQPKTIGTQVHRQSVGA